MPAAQAMGVMGEEGRISAFRKGDPRGTETHRVKPVWIGGSRGAPVRVVMSAVRSAPTAAHHLPDPERQLHPETRQATECSEARDPHGVLGPASPCPQ